MRKEQQLDRFSKQTKTYAKIRPTYPIEIYEFLSTLTPSRQKVWDCGTGNGQAALHLAQFFDHIYATDLSHEQIQNATPHERITYEACAAEDVALDESTVDLVTVAQAIHWFDLDRFYPKVKHVLKPGGIFAIWAYGHMHAQDEQVNELFQHIGNDLLKDYWDAHVKKIWRGYDSLDFPFEDISHPEWMMQTQWSRPELIAYIESWSAAQKYYDTHQKSVLEDIYDTLEKIWPNSDQKHIFQTPLTSRIGV